MRNKYLIVFFLLTLLSLLIAVTQSLKVFHLFVQHTLYMCQGYVSQHSMLMPHLIGISALIVSVLSLVHTLGKLLITYIDTRYIRRQMRLVRELPPIIVSMLHRYHIPNIVNIIDDTKPVAFCYGIRKPKIYVSTGLLTLMNTNELQSIILHEYYHVRQRDTVIMLFGSITKTLLPFVPIVGVLLEQYKIEREIKADRYASTILRSKVIVLQALKKLLIYPTSESLLIASMAEENSLEPRIHELVYGAHTTFKPKKIQVTLSVITIIVLSGIILIPVHAEGEKRNPAVQISCQRTVIPYFSYPASQDHASHPYSTAR